MRINNNLMAMNTHRQLGINANNGSKSIEKLSSGYRINRAGDDAAGLAISEKMRSQIRGLSQASRNSQDGISMIQTAEGALNETQAILQRMRELAVQSSNDTNVSEDRSALQNEIAQLTSEIDRIADTTEFNKQSLLKGDGGVNLSETGAITAGELSGAVAATTTEESYVFSAATGDAGEGVSITLNGETLTMTWAADNASITDDTAYNVTANSAVIDTASTSGDSAAADIVTAFTAMINANDTLKGNYTVSASVDQVTITAVKGGDFEGAKGSISTATATGITLSGNALTNGLDIPATKATGSIDLTSIATGGDVTALVGDGFTIGDTAIEFYNSNDGAYTGDAVGVDLSAAVYAGATDPDHAVVNAIVKQTANIEGVDLSINAGDAGILDITATTGGTAGNDIGFEDGAVAGKEFSAEFQIGANEGQKMEVTMNDMRAAALEIENVDISTTAGAQDAITVIDNALGKVSDERSKLGAFQNRLEHTIKNLDTSAENLQASESRIRDVDMAKEMMEFTKNNILQQAAQSMLAQANQAPQGVLQLLR